MGKIEHEKGLYLPDGSFRTDADIKRKLAIEGQTTPEIVTPLPVSRDFLYWSTRFTERSAIYNEAIQRNNCITLNFPHERTILNFLGDLHVGAPDTNYPRIQQEAEAIVNTPNSYVIALGDWVDAFFFNPAQFNQVEQAPEQFAYMRSLLEFYAENNRLLVAFGGDHDLWATKAGGDPYADFADKFGAFYMQGVGYITANIGSTRYQITGAHRHSGFSIYNKAQAAVRLYKDDAEGADICITAHTHQKAHYRQAVKEFGGTARLVDFISLGPYKAGDDYSRKKGYSDQDPVEMFGQAVALDPDKRNVTYYHDIIAAAASQQA